MLLGGCLVDFALAPDPRLTARAAPLSSSGFAPRAPYLSPAEGEYSTGERGGEISTGLDTQAT